MFLRTFRYILTNYRLADKRTATSAINKLGTWAGRLGTIIGVVFLLILGGVLPSFLSDLEPAIEPYHVLSKGFCVVLAYDFYFRFLIPSSSLGLQPYLLLPIKRSYLLHSYIIHQLIQGYNLIPLSFFASFAYVSIHTFYGWAGVIGFLLGSMMLIMISSLYFLFVRMMRERHFLFLFLFTIPLMVGVIVWDATMDKEWTIYYFCLNMGEGFILWQWKYFLLLLGILAFVYFLCMKAGGRMITAQQSQAPARKRKTKTYDAQAPTAQQTPTPVIKRKAKAYDSAKSLQRELMRLEWRLLWRNKYPRSLGYMWIFFALVFPWMNVFDDTILGITSAIANIFPLMYLANATLLMCPSLDGHYLEGLLVRKGAFEQILIAKYRVHVLVATAVLILLLITNLIGGHSLLYPLTHYFWVVGVLFCSTFYVMKYNKELIPLNAGMMHRHKKRNWTIGFFVMAALYGETLIISTLSLFLSVNTAYWILFLLSFVAFCSHSWIIKRLYRHWEKSRYQQLLELRSSK